MVEPVLAPPTFGRALSLWLATIGLGTLFITVFFVLIDSSEPVIPIIAGALAGAFSLPALLLLPVSIKWALAVAAAPLRRLRLLGLITCLFGLATLVCYVVMTCDSGSKADTLITIAEFAAPYFVAALLAAYWLYHNWLRTPVAE
jgi:hypothetical protein